MRSYKILSVLLMFPFLAAGCASVAPDDVKSSTSEVITPATENARVAERADEVVIDILETDGESVFAGGGNVYFTADISPEGLEKVYNALNWTPSGNVAVKISTGESERSNHLRPDLIGGLVKKVNGTIVECNTAYGGSRSSTAYHKQVAKDRGYTEIAAVDIMAEAGKAVSDALGNGDRITYINVMNRLSVDCDCNGNPAEPDMHDIGILASNDPVALDQACVDLIYAASDGTSVIRRIESRNGIHTIEHAASIGLGNRVYSLVDLDAAGTGDLADTTEDTTEDTWYDKALTNCLTNGILMNDEIKNPDASAPRTLIALMLHRMNGSPALSGGRSFTDIPSDGDVTRACAWTYDRGVMVGYDDGSFGAQDVLLREQMATILWSLNGKTLLNAEPFFDAADIAPYAVNAVNWARAEGAFAGVPGNRFDPKGNVSIAQAAVVIDSIVRSSQTVGNSGNTDNSTEEEEDTNMLKITVNGTTLNAVFENNSSADALKEKLKEGDLTINMRDYGNFEKVGSLPFSLPRNDTQITTVPGDVILYQGNQITIYYDANAWNFTRLAKIEDASRDSLLKILGGGDVTVTLSVK